MTDQALYRNRFFRVLLDMHIGDWDEGFLKAYDPLIAAQTVVNSGADAAMIYFQSHLGLCYWPTTSGVQHKGCCGRDFAGDTLKVLRAKDIPVCAYYSIGFNNQAYLDHPDWRIRPATKPSIGSLPSQRYGIVCINNLEYQAFVKAQYSEILNYDVDALFFDMVWWNGICLCASCTERYHEEHGLDIPTRVDWNDPLWLRFQAARQTWLSDFTIGLRNGAKALKPHLDVYHNFALGLSNYSRGFSFDTLKGHDFLGGDFYAGRAEQIFISRLMLNLTPNRPAEFMTTLTRSLTEHTGLRPLEAIKIKALAAMASEAAFLGILGIDPDGTFDKSAINNLSIAFQSAKPYAKFMGGDPIETVGIYFSDASRMDVTIPNVDVDQSCATSAPDYPHFIAASGAARILQRAHIPFGVLTKKNLTELSRWQVIVAPNIHNMDEVELSAIRAYVFGGGRLYASGLTSLDRQTQDFALSEVFGCHFGSFETGPLVYVQSVEAGSMPISFDIRQKSKSSALRIKQAGGDVLARLTLPFGYPNMGDVSDKAFASIHCWPPWHETNNPVIIKNSFGRGEVIYSAFSLESGGFDDQDQLFLTLVEGLMPGNRRLKIDTHPSVWVSVYEDVNTNRITLRLLHYPLEFPALCVGSARVCFKLKDYERLDRLYLAPDKVPIDYTIIGDDVHFEAGPIDPFAFVVLEFSKV